MIRLLIVIIRIVIMVSIVCLLYLIKLWLGQGWHAREALSKLLKREGRAGAEGAILPYVGHLQLISTLKIGADCCQLCQYKLNKPNLTYPNLT